MWPSRGVAPGAVLRRHQPLPGGELAPVLEVARVGNGSEHRRRGYRADAGDRGDALCHFVAFDVAFYLYLAKGDGFIEPREVGPGFSEKTAHHQRQRCVLFQLRQRPCQHLCRASAPDPKLSEQTTQPIDQRRAFLAPSLAQPVPRQTRLLLDRLHRHEAHIRLPHRRANRLGIVAIILRRPTLAKRLDELRRHEPWRVPVAGQPARPVVRRPARFHPEHARRQLYRPRRERLAPKYLA